LGTDIQKYKKAFRDLGARYRALRLDKGMVQEDALEYGFSVRHYQQLEAGRPHSLTTLFRIAEMYGVRPAELLEPIPPIKKTSKKAR